MSETPTPDADIVREILEDRTVGFEDLYRAHADRLYSYTRTLLQDQDRAAHVTQAALVKAVGNVGKLQDPEKLAPWLFAIARDESMPALMERKHWNDGESAIDMLTIDVDAATAVDSPQAQALVRVAADALAPADRDALALAMRSDLDVDDVALVMGVTPEQAQVRISSARSSLVSAVAAVILVREERRSCSGLAQSLVGFDGFLSPAMRERVTRHVESCGQCSERGRGRAEASVSAFVLPISMIPPPGFEAGVAGAVRRMDSSGEVSELEPVDDSGFPVPIALTAGAGAAAVAREPDSASDSTAELERQMGQETATLPVGIPAVGPPAPAAPVSADGGGGSKSRTWLWVVMAVVVLVMLAATAMLIQAGSGDEPSEPSPSMSPTSSPTPASTPTAAVPTPVAPTPTPTATTEPPTDPPTQPPTVAPTVAPTPAPTVS